MERKPSEVSNSAKFNTMIRIAPFQCNQIRRARSHGKIFAAIVTRIARARVGREKKSGMGKSFAEKEKSPRLLGTDSLRWRGKVLRSTHRALITTQGNGESVPLRRALQVDLHRLLKIGDVVPTPVGLPAVGNHLNQNAAGRRIGNVGNTLHVRLDVLLRLFVL